VKEINRIIDINLSKKQSAFLWGARKTGKTTFLKNRFKESIIFDFLKTDLFFEVSKRPYILREQILAKNPQLLTKPIIIDEVQKIPQVLDEVHWLIENKGISFILCGSNARKLRRGHSNLLGGRAWRYDMFPLVWAEISNFNLLRALNHGLLPIHYLQNDNEVKKSLQAYVFDYLIEEIFAEGLIRNIPAFSRFLEAFGYSHGELTNYSDIARDCAVESKTVKEYFQILVDTLLAIRIEPYKKLQSRQVIAKSPKYYLFDVGVAGFLIKRHIPEEKGILFGKAFEHFILMELTAYNSYKNLNGEINFWRTKTGYEVDFILQNGEIAIESKSSANIDKKDLRGLIAYSKSNTAKRLIIVCNEKEKRINNKIEIYPWREFLYDLWNGKIIN
jgi:predicted AAA+ superfamily ATPase